MKGTLKNKEGKWSIEYWDKLLPPNEIRSVLCELPLHPDSINGIEEPTDWVAYYYGREVEFEIVCKEGEIANHMLIKATGMEFPKYAKLISKQEELPNDNKLYKEIDNKDGSITLVPKNPDFGKIFPFGKQEESET